MLRRRALATALSVLLVGFALSPGGAPARSAGPAAPPEPATVVTGWEQILLDTVYGQAAPKTLIPLGVPLLGYTSVAMYDGVKRAARTGGSQSAAVAQAAHDVLVTYFPADKVALDDALGASLAAIPDGTAKTRGRHAGAAAAAAMVGRVEDPRVDAGHPYQRDPAPGVWQPSTTPFVGPWLGFMDKLVVKKPIEVDGPDPTTSADYAFDFQEVKIVGRATDADRTDRQTEVAQFFNGNAGLMVGQGLIGYLDQNPMSLKRTARLFAVMHGAMTDSVITCWRLKYDGFWRPFQAIQGIPGDDGNPATVEDPTWTSLLATPPYPDYVSGHACVTGPQVETIRMMLGEETSLSLHSTNPLSLQPDRTFTTLSEIEFDAFHARIWGGLHFRDAMEDGYLIGHTAARRAIKAIH